MSLIRVHVQTGTWIPGSGTTPSSSQNQHRMKMWNVNRAGGEELGMASKQQHNRIVLKTAEPPQKVNSPCLQ